MTAFKEHYVCGQPVVASAKFVWNNLPIRQVWISCYFVISYHVGIGRIGYPCNKLVWKRLSNVKKFKISIWINICSKFIDDGHGGVRQKLFQKEFGILINNKNPIYPGGLYKFAIYAYEVKHEAKFECGFISLNNGPLNCKLSINIKVF